MRVQTRPSSPQHLPVRNSLPLHLERGVGLEAPHHGQTDFIGRSEAIEGRTQHRESCSTITSKLIQK